ncbi:hypothetical protein [Asticcacaulis machinosus]|uniref:Uncharacterized protein n=1 Tax=Asticcacaulis machinosus TaxID=2984211 RepID=A0ABT5HGM5_9CAUL|nr:hypothetical protein [Asticcacaulis machinosus]MDC7675394.1 hypothetical protein [Asticcacaulis machinosus]
MTLKKEALLPLSELLFSIEQQTIAGGTSLDDGVQSILPAVHFAGKRLADLHESLQTREPNVDDEAVVLAVISDIKAVASNESYSKALHYRGVNLSKTDFPIISNDGIATQGGTIGIGTALAAFENIASQAFT